MQELNITANQLIASLLSIAGTDNVCILDSCGVGHLGSHLMIAGIRPLEIYQFSSEDIESTLKKFDEKLSSPELAAIFTISYDFGLKLQKIIPKKKEKRSEPDIFLALFDCLIIHDYDTGKTRITGNENGFSIIVGLIDNARSSKLKFNTLRSGDADSNFTKDAYLRSIDTIKDRIRAGETYQTNLTQQMRVDLPVGMTAGQIFSNLRTNHPAPFASFLVRNDSTVISASPERFLSIKGRNVSVSPIKGTRPRGTTPNEDTKLRNELLASEKDRAENTMIVDLMRNDLGRVCEFGSVHVEKLCDLEEHPTLFHLVSTVTGKLKDSIGYSDIIKAVFPCGSITGAPKIRTMQIIEDIEPVNRGLSMGAIGYRIPSGKFGISESFDMSVAIRTMVVRNQKAVFNVGGGIVIDSEPESEYNETLLKSRALLDAMGSEFRPNAGLNLLDSS